MRVRRNRIPAHRLGTNAEAQINLLQRNRISSLTDRLYPGAANALNQKRGPIDRNARIQSNVPRQHISIETSLRHASGDHGADVGRRNFRAFENRARSFDTEVGRRYESQRTVVIDEWRAHAVEKPDVVIPDEKPILIFYRHFFPQVEKLNRKPPIRITARQVYKAVDARQNDTHGCEAGPNHDELEIPLYPAHRFLNRDYSMFDGGGMTFREAGFHASVAIVT